MLKALFLAWALPLAAAPRVENVGLTFRGYSSAFPTVAVSPDGRFALTGDERANVVLWDLAAGTPARVLRGHTARVFSAAFSPDGAKILSGSWDGTLRLWSVDSGKVLRTIAGGGKEIMTAAFSPDGRQALSGDRGGAVKLWDLDTGALARTFSAHAAPVAAAAFTPDGRRAVTTDMDNKAVVWDVAGGAALRTLQERGHFIVGRGIAGDGRSFLFGGESLKLVDIESGAVLRTFEHPMPADLENTAVAFSPDGRFFIAESGRHLLRLWEAKTGRLERTYLGPRGMVSVAFTPDAKGLVGSFGFLPKLGTIISWPVEAPDLPDAEPARPVTATADSAALGKLLFFDPRLSRDGRISCATCHDPKKGWTDQLPLPRGIGGKKGRRNTLSVLNAAAHEPLFWDGRAVSLEDQVRFPLSHPGEMGSSPEDAARSVAAVPSYRPLFKAAFGDEAATPERIARALADFERTLVLLDSPYDRHDLSTAALRGLGLFKGKARCFICHELSPSRNPEFINIGLKARDDPRDLGRFEVTRNEKDKGAFIVPDLRNLRHTAPYMHDGSLKNLAAVVDFYDKGGEDNPRKFDWMMPLHLSPAEKADLVSFLESMSGELPASGPGGTRN